MALRALWDVTQQFQNKNGSNLTSGKIYIYYQGRTALATTYHDEDGTVVNSNPVLLDNNGRATAFADPIYSYTIVVCDYYGKELFSQDITLHDAISTAEDVVVLGTDGTVLVDRTELPNGVQYDLSVNTDILATKEYVDDEVDNLQEQIDDKKDKQTALTFNGSATKTVKKVTQDANGVISVEYEDIDLPPEVPNVEITSEDNSIQVTETTDVQTNTKTFDLSVNVDDALEYGQFRATNVTGQAQLSKIKGNLDLNNYSINMKKGNSYHFTIRGSYVANSAVNTSTTISYIEYSSFTNIPVNVDNTITDPQYFEISYDVYNYGQNSAYNVSFASMLSGKVSELWVEVHNLNGVSVNGSGVSNIVIAREYNGVIDDTYDGMKIRQTDNGNEIIALRKNNNWYSFGQLAPLSAGADKILITDSNGTVHWGVVGNGLEIDNDTLEVKIDSEVGDVVETVEKLKTDLDTQLTVNFDMPNVDNVYDFADSSVIGMSNGAVMLCQAFTVPINHDIRVDDGETENPTLLGIYAKQAFTGKKIMLALYVYDFDTGYTDYVGDTGPVEVTQGRNEFPLVHINPDITELKSSCVYYASLYLPSNAHSNGLYLAGCPSYSNASYINATPRFTVGVENIVNPNTNQEIDMSNATTGRLDFNDGNGNYYIGPWSDNYNERPAIPRFFMQIRNGDAEAPVVVEPFTDIGSYTLKNTSSVTDVFGSTITVNTSTYGAIFMEVTPAQDVDVTGWVCYDNYSIDERQWYGTVFDSSFENQLSSASNGTISELGEITTGVYGHEFTRSSALHLTANTTYRFLVCIPHSSSDMLVQYNTPSVPKNLHLFESGYNVSQWVTYSRANNVQGIDFLIKDANHEWRI